MQSLHHMSGHNIRVTHHIQQRELPDLHRSVSFFRIRQYPSASFLLQISYRKTGI